MELLSPAGNFEKLKYAFLYGADAAYLGLPGFSLRAAADNFFQDEASKIRELRKQFPEKKIYCALNISFHQGDLKNLADRVEEIRSFGFDAFIVQDLGAVDFLQKNFPRAKLHLSTQANCINAEAAKMYRKLGFSRIVLGREASLAEIAEIKNSAPEIQLETFIHGAMCIAYAGRCLLSAYSTGRSANSGECAHSCRWEYRLLEERKRPGQFLPILETDRWTEILSSKDLCMIDHLAEFKKAGVDSLKIEGRMKSLYYTALVTRAYRKAIDLNEGLIDEDTARPFINELKTTAHREWTTGFYFNKAEADKTTDGATFTDFDLIGTLGEKLSSHEVLEIAQNSQKKFDETMAALHPIKREHLLKKPENNRKFLQEKPGFNLFPFNTMNKVDATETLEFVSPGICKLESKNHIFVDPNTGEIQNFTAHGIETLIYSDLPLGENFIVRKRIQESQTPTDRHR